MDPHPKIILSNFVFWTTSPSDILPPAADLKISFGRNGESFGISSPLKRCDEVWTDLGLPLLVPACGILFVDVLQAGYSVPSLENSDRTYSKLGSVYIDLGELLDISDDISNPEMHMSGTARYATTVVMEADYLPVLHCSMAVIRFRSVSLVGSLYSLHLPAQICEEQISDADFKKCAEELEGFSGPLNGDIFLILTPEQVGKIRDRCLSMQSPHDQIHLIALFAGLLNDQFLLRLHLLTRLDIDPPMSRELYRAIDVLDPHIPERIEMYTFSRDLYQAYGALIGGLEESHQTDFIVGLLNLPDTSPTKTLCIQSFGSFLAERSLAAEDHDGLTRAIFFLETVERLRLHAYASDPVLDQHKLYLSLFATYRARGAVSQNVVDIDKALVFADKAKKLIPSSSWRRYPEKTTYALTFDVAEALAFRYVRSRDHRDLHKAKELVEEGLALFPRDSSRYLDVLQVSARVLCDHCEMDETANRESAILRHEELLVLLPPEDHDAVARATYNLAGLYTSAEEIDRAIQLCRDYVDANPNCPHIDDFVERLGRYLTHRFIRPWCYPVSNPVRRQLVPLDSEDLRDLDEAIAVLSRTHVPSLGLAHALMLRYMFCGNHLSDSRAAISIVSRAASTLESPFGRYTAAYSWARFAERLSGNDRHSSGMAAYSTAMSLVPSLIWLGMGLEVKYNMLALLSPLTACQVPNDKRLQDYQSASIGQTSNRSAAFAISHGEYCTAIEWLEQGRSIIWDQMLQLRVSLESLELVDKDLAERLGAIGRELAISTARSGSWATRMDEAGKKHEASLEAEGQKHRRLTHHWETGIAEARRLPGFEDFLAPKPFVYLSRAADDCTVVIINTHEMGTDVLVLFPTGSNGHSTDILHIPLSEAHTLLKIFQDLTALTGSLSLDSERKPIWKSTSTFTIDVNLKFGVILHFLWYSIVLPILVHCNQTRPDLFSGSPGVARPRVRWYPTGLLSFLPLHAAGDYTTSHTGHKVYDFVISSYIPTLNSIIRDHPTPSSTCVENPKILAVSCATPRGFPPIIGTQAELSTIQQHAHLAGCELTAVSEQDATADRVLEEIKDAHWVHFACHGVQNTKSPLQSALILQNGTRATLSDFAALDLPHAELAYLSACQTAAGYDAVPSESIHLAAGMLLAGFRSVIATMWPIQDRYAPDVADSVYGYLLRGGQHSTPDYKESAVALDLAVQRLREKVGEDNFLSWVPYIHIGV